MVPRALVLIAAASILAGCGHARPAQMPSAPEPVALDAPPTPPPGTYFPDWPSLDLPGNHAYVLPGERDTTVAGPPPAPAAGDTKHFPVPAAAGLHSQTAP